MGGFGYAYPPGWGGGGPAPSGPPAYKGGGAGLKSPAHTGGAVTPTTPIPAGQPGGELAPKPNGLADFANSALGQWLGQNGSPNANQYLSAFQGALGAARGNIQQQLAAALGDIQSSQQAAGQALGTLPGQIDQAYGQANGTIDSSLGSLEAAQKKSGVGSLMPVSAYMQPERAALTGSQAAAQANVPLLGMGIQQEAGRERAQANMAALGDQSQLDQIQAQGALQAATANNGLSPQQQFAEQVFMQNLQGKQNISQIQAQAKANPPSSSYSPAAGAYGTNGLSSTDVQTAHTSPQYATYARMINEGSIKSVADLQKALPGSPGLWRTLAVDFQLPPK